MILREAKGGCQTGDEKTPSTTSESSSEMQKSSLALRDHTAYPRLLLRRPDLSRDTRGKFVDALLKDDLVPLLARLLSFVAEDLISSPRERRRVLPAQVSSIMIDLGLQLLVYCISSRNAPHWTAVLFKLGFLRTVARILPFVQRLGCKDTRALEGMFCTRFPLSLCHWFVVAAAVKAVKEITLSGDVAKIETSIVREFWMVFTNVLLERTVLSTVYERNFAASDIKMCENVCPVDIFLSLKCRDDLINIPKVQEEETRDYAVQVLGLQVSAVLFERLPEDGLDDGRAQARMQRDTRRVYYSALLPSKLAHPIFTVIQLGEWAYQQTSFLDFIGLAELRRHMPGLSSRLLANDDPSHWAYSGSKTRSSRSCSSTTRPPSACTLEPTIQTSRPTTRRTNPA